MSSMLGTLENTVQSIVEKVNPFGDLAKTKERIHKVFDAQMTHHYHMGRTTAKERKAKLKTMLKWIYAHREDIHKALKSDFNKPEAETDLSEILAVTGEIKHALKHLSSWMKPTSVDTSLTFMTTNAWIEYESRGVVLIIAPWNFPFNLTVGPLVSAIAAGNCVILKPSEYSPATSALIDQMVTELFPENEVAIFHGDKEVSEVLLDKPFHHIFFTGSPAVGKVVQMAAAKHLSTVTLELGGKSPAIIDKHVNMDDAVKKIAWGKFMNNGQTCIAPDYALVHQDRYEEFVEKMRKTVQAYYGAEEQDRKESPHYARIISTRHHGRLKDLLKKTVDLGAKVEFGGEADESQRYLAPTLLSNVPLESPLMQEEIFGPILPVIPVNSIHDAVSFVQQKDKPLALYIFSTKQKNIDLIMSHTTAGGTSINDTLTHFLHPNLPFGGVNFSGSGNSHGHFGFRTFSHERAVLRHNRFSPMKMMYPPYTPFVRKLISMLVKYM